MKPSTCLAELAEEWGIGLSPETLEEMARTVGRLQRDLAWRGWDEGVRFAVPDVEKQPKVSSRPEHARLLEAALDRARPAAEGGAYVYLESGRPRAATEGPLKRFTFAVKDLVAVAGRALRAGSSVRRDAPPQAADAPVVAALRRAGAVLVGATALHEFAFGVTGINDHTGTPRNPHDPARIPGGSSSGSAVAVAEGSARVAVGTDTGGSVRIPAALCGVVGFKPAKQSHSAEGVFPLAPSLDHVGFLAETVGDIAAVHAALGGPASPPSPVGRVGFVRGELERAEREVRDGVEDALDQLARSGAELVEIDWPDAEEVFAVSTTIMFVEAAAHHRTSLETGAARYGADVRNRLLLGSAIDTEEYVMARAAQAPLSRAVEHALQEVDCVVGPTVPCVAPTVDQARDARVSARLVENTRLANVVGTPALSLPVPNPELPVGLQVTAVTEERLLAAAAHLEKLLAS